MHRAGVDAAQGTYDWMHFAARSGEQGCAWSATYRRYEPLEAMSIEALAMLRRGELESGETCLERLREDLAACGAPASVRAVLDRWYHGVAGFLHYRRGDFEAADESMFAAHEAVSAAVGHHRFLLLLANHCHEFCLHRARIARNQRRWRRMEEHVELARGMMADRLPLCRLADGTPVFFATLADYFGSLPWSEAERAWLADFLDADARLRLFERFVGRMLVQPGFAIPYP